jgi:hypothetical protein
MKEKEIFVGPCSKFVDGQGWTTEIPVEMLKEKGYVKADEQLRNKKQGFDINAYKEASEEFKASQELNIKRFIEALTEALKEPLPKEITEVE